MASALPRPFLHRQCLSARANDARDRNVLNAVSGLRAVVNVVIVVHAHPSFAPSASELRAKQPRRKSHISRRQPMVAGADLDAAGDTLRAAAQNHMKEDAAGALTATTFRRRRPSRSKTALPGV